VKQLPPVQHELALKALAWESKRGTFVSPSHNEFAWSRDGLVTAKCPWHKSADGMEDDTNSDEYIPSNDHCGMYVSFRWGVIEGYMYRSVSSAVFLVEGYGKLIVSTDGFRAAQLLLRAVCIDKSIPQIQRLAGMQASRYFDIPTIEKEPMLIAMDIQNTKLHRDWYEPESRYMKHLPVEQVTGLLEKV